MSWTLIPDWNGWYEITEDGDIRISPTAPNDLYARLDPGDAIGIHIDRGGYCRVNLKHPESRRYQSFGVHRLLLRAFRPIDEWESLQVNHLNGVKSDNRLDNIEWCTQRENLAHAWESGLRARPQHAILTPEQVVEIRAFRKTELGGNTPMSEIGARYGVTRDAIWRIVNNKNWLHLL